MPMALNVAHSASKGMSTNDGMNRWLNGSSAANTTAPVKLAASAINLMHPRAVFNSRSIFSGRANTRTYGT